MIPNVSALERAFQLAASGNVKSIQELRLALSHEGYLYDQVKGRTLKKQLMDLIRRASPPADTAAR